MTAEQIEKTASLKADIASKGLLIKFVASKFNMTKSRMSNILSGKETYVSNVLLQQIIDYIAQVNTNDIKNE